MKLDVRSCALTTGLLWAATLFLVTWWLIVWEGPSEESMWLSRIYLGYRVTPLGSLIGLAWALPDGAVGGALFAWLYNRLAREKIAGPSV